MGIALFSGNFTAGVLEIKGNLTQENTGGDAYYYKNNFNQSGTFKVIFSGCEEQTVSIETPYYSSFNEIDTTNSKGVVFDTEISLRKLTGLDNVIGQIKIISCNSCNDYQIKLDSDWVVNALIDYKGNGINLNGYNLVIYNKLTLSGGKIDIAGGELKITGDLITTNGTVYINSGKLNIEGNYQIEKDSSLVMKKNED